MSNTSHINTFVKPKVVILPLVIVMSLMFIWNLSRNINDVLIPHLKRACQLNDLQSSLVQSAFFGAYFLCALPVGYFLKKTNYKTAMLTGLLLAAGGGLLFYPAAETRQFPVFLLALFTMAAGFTFLEVSATPYVSLLGSEQTAASRLDLAAAFGSVGATLGPYLGATLLLRPHDVSSESLQQLPPTQLLAFLNTEAEAVQTPYLALAGVLLALAVGLLFVQMPTLRQKNTTGSFRAVLRHRHTVLGALAVFCYLGAEVGIVSFMIRYLKFLNIEGITERKAAYCISVYMGLVLAGRFIGAAVLRHYPPARLLIGVSGAAMLLVLASVVSAGYVALATVVLVGLFSSVMYGIIFSLSIRGLGENTEQGSSLLIMSIVGGALVPPLMGWISDSHSIRWAYLVPAVCYLYLVFYGRHTYRSKDTALRNPVPHPVAVH